MTQLLTLSRAAQLLGVSRHVLQKQIHDGQLAAHDGMVASEELLRVYPGLNVEDSGLYEPVTPMAGFSLAKCARERILPPKEILARRLATQGRELAEVRKHLARYHDLIEALREKIESLATAAPSPEVEQLRATLEQGLAAILGSQEAVDKVEVMAEVLRVIAAHVTVKPSGHEFFVEGAETVLEAALHAGLAPSYGCGNGNCGLCKARVIEGELRQVRNFDYPMSAVEQAQNYKLLCSHTAVSDVVIEMIEAHTPADIPEQQIVARVKSVSSLDDRTYLLHLETPCTNRLRFLAGQGVTLGIAGDRAHYRGDFPVASCPCDDRNLLFHVSRTHVEMGNAFAGRLFAGGVHAGDTVDVWGPFGEFVLRQNSLRPLLFVCCDTGFAPVKSVIEHAMAVDMAPTMALYWVATRPGGQYLANQCRAWAASLDNFRFRALDAADANAAAQAAVSAALADLPDTAGWDAYLAGPGTFIDAAAASLRAAGLPMEQIVAAVA
jgi:CDP-4-dehydro-6-deoxyglucose reductase, E3